MMTESMTYLWNLVRPHMRCPSCGGKPKLLLPFLDDRVKCSSCDQSFPIASWKVEGDLFEARVEEREAEAAAMREALRPFAEEGGIWLPVDASDKTSPFVTALDGEHIAMIAPTRPLTVGIVRAAARASLGNAGKALLAERDTLKAQVAELEDALEVKIDEAKAALNTQITALEQRQAKVEEELKSAADTIAEEFRSRSATTKTPGDEREPPRLSDAEVHRLITEAFVRGGDEERAWCAEMAKKRACALDTMREQRAKQPCPVQQRARQNRDDQIRSLELRAEEARTLADKIENYSNPVERGFKHCAFCGSYEHFAPRCPKMAEVMPPTESVDHSQHGLGTASGGPAETDCECRGTADEVACAGDGCGFCRVQPKNRKEPAAAAQVASEHDQFHEAVVGAFGGACNRTACRAIPATWFNASTRAFYCRECARKINEYAPGLCIDATVRGPR